MTELVLHDQKGDAADCRYSIQTEAGGVLFLFNECGITAREVFETFKAGRERALSQPEPTEGRGQKAPISQYQIELLARARARIAKSQVRYGEKVAYPADMHLVIDLVAQIKSLTSALEADAAIRAMPLQDHGKDSEIERLTLELGRTRAEVVQRQDDLGRLLHAAEAKNEQQAKHIEELNAKMTCMCGSEINHSAWEGHSPVSMFDYAVEQEVERRLSRPMVAEEREAKS